MSTNFPFVPWDLNQKTARMSSETDQPKVNVDISEPTKGSFKLKADLPANNPCVHVSMSPFYDLISIAGNIVLDFWCNISLFVESLISGFSLPAGRRFDVEMSSQEQLQQW